MFLTLTNATTIIDHRRSQRPAGRGSPQVVIAAIADGFAVVDAYTATPTDLVLFGAHRGPERTASGGPAAGDAQHGGARGVRTPGAMPPCLSLQ